MGNPYLREKTWYVIQKICVLPQALRCRNTVKILNSAFLLYRSFGSNGKYMKNTVKSWSLNSNLLYFYCISPENQNRDPSSKWKSWNPKLSSKPMEIPQIRKKRKPVPWSLYVRSIVFFLLPIVLAWHFLPSVFVFFYSAANNLLVLSFPTGGATTP